LAQVHVPATAAGGRAAPAAAAGAAAAVALVVSAVAYRALVHDHGQRPSEAVAQILVGWTFLVAGATAWWLRRSSTVGVLLVAAGAALLVRRLQYSHVPGIFTVGFAFGELSSALIAHAVLAYPSGRLAHRAERVVVAAAYAAALVLPSLTLLFYDPRASRCFFECTDAVRPRSMIALHESGDVALGVHRSFVVVAFGVIGLSFIALVGRKLARAGAATRWLQGPLLVAAVAAGVRVVAEGVIAFTSPSDALRQVLFWWQIAVQVALPLALLVGLLRERLAHAAVADVLPHIEAGIEDALRRALRDPRLRIAFWRSDTGGYVDADGAPVDVVPAARGVTVVERDARPLAALLHDEMLSDQPELVRAAASAASLALENARLAAELRAQLAEVRQSRARLVTAAAVERRRIERDLHDGVQQRLLALAVSLQRSGEVDAVAEVRSVLAELRDLTHGIHPSALTTDGLAGAVADAARRAPFTVDVHVDVSDRPAAEIEATAYFVVCEGLANAAKHARATHARVRVVRDGSVISVDVADDGVGGADLTGSGLRGLADRVEALGGRLTVAGDSGTCIHAELPCVS
jgi:signal transduction histidine kinase